MKRSLKATLIDEVRTAYADAGKQREPPQYVSDMRCLKFLTSAWATPEVAVELVEYIGPYNAFDPEWVDAAMEQVHLTCDGALVAVGREMSPVLYVESDSPEAVMEVLRDEYDVGDDDGTFAPSGPDELSVVSAGAVGTARKDPYGGDDGMDPHSTCTHDAPPVAVEDYADTDPDRSYVRAWWD